MALDPERRQFAFGGLVFGIGRRVVPGVGRHAALRLELDGLGHRVVRGVHVHLV